MFVPRSFHRQPGFRGVLVYHLPVIVIEVVAGRVEVRGVRDRFRGDLGRYRR
jgi:hypothetical protein